MAAMWTFALARLAGILLLGLCLGLLIGPIWLWLLGAACFYLAWQLLNLYRVDRWLRLRSQIDPPNIGGIWGDIIAQVIRLHRRKQYHKQRLVQLYRELRRSTAALPDGVIILSTQREIVWFNRQAARLLGLRRPVDVGLRIDNLIRAPEFAHYLHGDDFALPLVIRPPVQPGDLRDDVAPDSANAGRIDLRAQPQPAVDTVQVEQLPGQVQAGRAQQPQPQGPDYQAQA